MSAECWQEQSHHPYFGIRKFKPLYLQRYEQAAAKCLHAYAITYRVSAGIVGQMVL